MYSFYFAATGYQPTNIHTSLS